jgi:putative acetyltransferase
MRLQLRAARAEDCVAIAEVWHAAWHDAHDDVVPPELLPHRALAHFLTLAVQRFPAITVAVHGEQVVGFVGLDEDEGELELLFVAGHVRGCGVADALIGHAEQQLARSYECAHLLVVVKNDRARRFYARHGWQDVAPHPYAATIAGGSVDVPHRRYEKALRESR